MHLYPGPRADTGPGLTSQANLTWSRALGTSDVPQTRILYTPVDAWNLGTSYGSQPYDFKLLYNQILVYREGRLLSRMARYLGAPFWAVGPSRLCSRHNPALRFRFL